MQTIEIQTIRVFEALTCYRYSLFLYLSSTRLYQGNDATHEKTPIIARPWTNDAIYNLTKATAECLCMSIDNPTIQVARLSSVYDPELASELFIADVMRKAVATGVLTFGPNPASSKDYAHVADVTRLLPQITVNGRQRLYSVAFGEMSATRQLAWPSRHKASLWTSSPVPKESPFRKLTSRSSSQSFRARNRSLCPPFRPCSQPKGPTYSDDHLRRQRRLRCRKA